MADRNRHCLSRHIPEQIAREVRRKSGFGCVICRSAIYTYEHIDPPFADAREHDPEAICLLCPTCHALSTKGRIPKDRIARAYRELQENPQPARPRDPEFFVPHEAGVTIELGSCAVTGFTSILRIESETLLSYVTTDGDPPYVVNGLFRDEAGTELFRIEKNEWIGPTDVFDVTQVGARLSIRRSQERALFEAEKDVSANAVRITSLDMLSKPFHVFLTEDVLAVGHLTPENSSGVYYVLYAWRFVGGDAAIALEATGQGEPAFAGIELGGGGGARLVGTGITIGAGAKRMEVKGGMMVIKESCDLGPTASESFRRRIMRGDGAMKRVVDGRRG